MRGLVTPRTPRSAYLRAGYNTSGTTAPAQGIGQLQGAAGDNSIYLCQPVLSGLQQCCVMAEPIAADTPGRIIQYGEALVTVTLAAGESVSVGDTLGSKLGQWTAQVMQGGPLTVEKVFDEIPAGGGDVTVLARFGRRRADWVYLKNNGDDDANVYQVIHLGSGLTLTEDEPGVGTLATDD